MWSSTSSLRRQCRLERDRSLQQSRSRTLTEENAHEHDRPRQPNRAAAEGSRRDILVGVARGALAGAAAAIGSDVAAQPTPAPLRRVGRSRSCSAATISMPISPSAMGG
jgi:hypothetical protein